MNSTAKRVLITGASGFLGQWLVKHFRAQTGWEVLSVAGRRELRKLAQAGSGPLDVIIHGGFEVDFSPLASGQKEESANIRSTREILSIVHTSKAEHVIFLSAAGALGVSKEPRARGETMIGTSDGGFEGYLNSKYIQEKIRSELMLTRGLSCKLTTLYLTTVYAPGMPAAKAGFLKSISSFNPLLLVPPGGTSLLGMKDFLRAVDAAIETQPQGGFVISSSNETFAAFFKLATRAAGTSFRKRVVPLPKRSVKAISSLARLKPGKIFTGAVLVSAFGYKYYSPEKARREFGWTPRQSTSQILLSVLQRGESR